MPTYAASDRHILALCVCALAAGVALMLAGKLLDPVRTIRAGGG